MENEEFKLKDYIEGDDIALNVSEGYIKVSRIKEFIKKLPIVEFDWLGRTYKTVLKEDIDNLLGFEDKGDLAK